MSGGVLAAGQTLSGEGVAVLCVAIAGAGPAGGEAPVARQAAVTLTAVRSGDTRALACGLVAEGVLRALGVAVTGWTGGAGGEVISDLISESEQLSGGVWVHSFHKIT